jgi:outer membrane protein TolC
MNRQFSKNTIVLLLVIILTTRGIQAQQIAKLTLQQAIEAAKNNNELIHIKRLQVLEQNSRIKESKVKLYPAVSLNAGYQYNTSLGQLNIPAGAFGTLPLYYPTTGLVTMAMPNENKTFDVSKHGNANAGATVYQPLTQLGKIKTGIDIARKDLAISALDESRTEVQIINAIEQCYYGILAIRKRKEEALKNIEAAKLKLYDIQSALLAGKTTAVNELGLKAALANDEQELLKLKFQEEDYLADFKKLTGLSADELIFEDADMSISLPASLLEYQASAALNNIDLQISNLQKEKSELAVKAAKQSYLPEVGVFVGYSFQQGNNIMPESNPFAGASFKWNLQDVFTNGQMLSQSHNRRQQAEANEKYIKTQTAISIEKAYRKMKQAEEMIAVAQKTVNYRKAELKIKVDQKQTGLSKPLNVLETEADLAKSQADLYGAIMNYKVALADLKVLNE